MTDDRSGDDEKLVWLEAVDDEDGPQGVPARKMLWAVLVVLFGVALVAGTLFWIGRRDSGGSGGAPELIRAEPGPYKVKPDDPGGLDVAGESETAFATSAGEDRDAELNLDALPETAVERPKPAAEAPKTEPEPAAPAPAPAPAPAAAPAGGGMVQLGFYDNPAQANSAWDALSKRFSVLGAMTKVVVPYQKGWRLRASAATPDEAKRTCQLLRVAGENCFVVR